MGCHAMMGKPWGPISGGKRWVFAAAGGGADEPGSSPGGSSPGGSSDAPAEIHCWICGGSAKPPMPPVGAAAAAGGEKFCSR